jgi:predicted TIM-barrel fold metal-dependent hydrolase
VKSRARCFEELRAYAGALPVVDCHDHAASIEPVTDILAHLAATYLRHDLISASCEADIERVRDASLPLDERWVLFERAWRRTRFSGYGLNVRMAVEKVFGEKEITLESARRMQAKLPLFADERTYYALFDQARIAARVAHIDWAVDELVGGTHEFLKGQRLAIGLAQFHHLTARADVEKVEALSGRRVRSLEDYLAACRAVFEAQRSLGAVAFKDNSAYTRSLAFRSPRHAAAEEAFNRLLADPLHTAAYDPWDNPLSDYLFHSFMQIARDFDVPVQIHTGHVAGNDNDVAKANAALLRPLVAVHRDVRFDLFHGNWPYSGDLLFLVKNYPNVTMDLCWAHIIDPLYSRDLLMRAVSSVPHGKIHGFGSDVGGGEADFAWAHCEMAKDNIAAALSELVEIGHVGLDDAKEIAADVLFNNPNEFFRLGLKIEDYTG